MESKGPYKVEQFGARNRNEFVVVGPGWEKVCEIYTRSGAEKAALYSNISYAEGRKAAENEYKELLEITGFLANVLNEIAYGFVHERDDIPGEGCNCNDDYAKAALELSYEDFIDWRRRHGGLNEKH